VQVSAEEAAARLTAAPAHDNSDWPQCAGKCHEGMCALRSDHPACCYVPKSQSYHLTTGRPYSVDDSAESAADVQSSGHWKSRDWFCWK
jgi:hypothetical protein